MRLLCDVRTIYLQNVNINFGDFAFLFWCCRFAIITGTFSDSYQQGIKEAGDAGRTSSPCGQ